MVFAWSVAAGSAYPAAQRASGESDRLRFLAGWNEHADFFQSKDSKFGNFQITPDYELGLGRNTQINLPPSADSEAQQFVQQLATRVITASPALIGEVRVQLYDDSGVNAVTVPGRMFVSSGLVVDVRNEAELAAVVSHELGHLYAHHASRRLIKAARGQALVAFIGGALAAKRVSANAQGFANLATNIGLDLYLKAYYRSEELEADRYATHLMYNAGFDPAALSTALARLSGGRKTIGLFSTHPPMHERLKDLARYTESFPDRSAQADSPAFLQAIKKVPQPAANPAPVPAPETTSPTPAATTPAVVTPPPASSLPPVVAPPASSLPPVKRPPVSFR